MWESGKESGNSENWKYGNLEKENGKYKKICTWKIYQGNRKFKCRTVELTTLKNENWEEKESKFIYIKGQWESAKLRVVQNIEWTNNSKIVGISIVFQI